MEEKKLYSCKEAAGLVEKFTEYMIRKYIREGKLIPVRMGRNIYVTKEELLRVVYEADNERENSSVS